MSEAQDSIDFDATAEVPTLALGDWAIYHSTKNGHPKLALVVGTSETTVDGTSLNIEDGTVNLLVFGPRGTTYARCDVEVSAAGTPGTVGPKN
jgi:hypothetical protein